MEKVKNSKSGNRVYQKYNEILSTLKVSDISPAIDEEDRRKYSEEKGQEKKKLSALETMLFNMALIQVYHDISIEQARFSFALAVTTCTLGIGFFLYASISVLVLHVELSSALIPAIGGALTEFIAGTVFILYKKSVEQMNIYFSSLQSNERFLSAVNLVQRVSPDKQDEILCEIIKSRLDNAAPPKTDAANPDNANPDGEKP
jgi:hypothetical protein